jgi:hypothetical protein
MRSLAFGVTIPDSYTRLARLETDNASLLAAHGAAAGRRIVTIIHFNITIFVTRGNPNKNHFWLKHSPQQVHSTTIEIVRQQIII